MAFVMPYQAVIRICDELAPANPVGAIQGDDVMVFVLIWGFAPAVFSPIDREEVDTLVDRLKTAISRDAMAFKEGKLVYLGVMPVAIPPDALL